MKLEQFLIINISLNNFQIIIALEYLYQNNFLNKATSLIKQTMHNKHDF